MDCFLLCMFLNQLTKGTSEIRLYSYNDLFKERGRKDCQLHLLINRLKHPLLIINVFSLKKSQEVIPSVFVFYFMCVPLLIVKPLCNMHGCLLYINTSISRLKELVNLQIKHTRTYLFSCTFLKTGRVIACK